MAEHPRHLRSDLMLLVTAAIWGTAFVFQEIAVSAGLPPLLFNALRFALGGLVLLPLVLVMRRRVRRGFLNTSGDPPPRPLPGREGEPEVAGEPAASSIGAVVLGGVLMGVALTAGAWLQQAGLGDAETTAGKGGFITGLYVVLVPVLGIAVGRRTDAWVWVGVVCALAGLFLLSINLDDAVPTISRGDGLVLLGTLFWAAHILLIDHLSKRHDALVLSVIQFFVCAALSAVIGLGAGEELSSRAIAHGWHAIAYCGVMSVAVAYTLQVVAQRDAHPAAAAVIMSSEVLFAAVGGALILDETMSGRAMLGCGLMLAGMLVSQLAPRRRTVVVSPESA